MADDKTQIGTGTDPLGRWPKGQAITPPLTGSALKSALDAGHVIQEDAVNELAEAKADVLATTYEPATEDNRETTDRRFEPEEAAAIDARNRQSYVEARRRRFERRIREGRRPA